MNTVAFYRNLVPFTALLCAGWYTRIVAINTTDRYTHAIRFRRATCDSMHYLERSFAFTDGLYPSLDDLRGLFREFEVMLEEDRTELELSAEHR